MASKRDDCLDKIARLGGMSREAAERLLDGVDGMADAQRQAGAADPAFAAAFDLAGRFKQAAKDARLDALRNVAARNTILERIEAEGGIENAAAVLRSIMHWVPGARRLDSIQGQWHGLSKQWLAVVGNELRQKGLWSIAKSGELDREVSRAMWDLNEKGQSSFAGSNDPAEQIASAFKPALDLAKDRMNNAGAHIGTATDFVMHTSWNPRQLRAAAGPGSSIDDSFGVFLKDMTAWASEKTYEHLKPEFAGDLEAAKVKFWRSFYEATMSGIHMGRPDGLMDDGSGYIAPGYEGSRNIAKAASQARVAFFKDADSWHEAMQKYGGAGTLALKLSSTLNQSARAVGLMERLGTNPQGNFETIVRRLEEKYRTDDGLSKFQDKVHGLQMVLDRLTGKANRPANAFAAQLFEYAMTYEAMIHLGGVAVTHVAAGPATVGSELIQHGVSPLLALGHTMRAVLTGRGSAERQEALAELGSYAIGYNLDLHTKWQPGAGVPGAISYLASHFMRLTTLDHFLTQFQGQGVNAVLSTMLGRGMEKGGLEAVHPWQRELLNRYGIGNEEWAALKSAPPLMVEGQRFVTPRAAEEASEETIKEILRRKGVWDGQDVLPGTPQAETLTRAIQRERWELGDRLLQYMNDSAEHATVTPGVRERAMIYRETRPGSLPWMIMRSLSQFKMWPIAAANQILGRNWANAAERSESTAGRLALFGRGMFYIAAASTVGGYIRISMNDLAAGRPLRNPLDPHTMLASLAAGGGLGIFGDFAFGETNRMGAGIVATAAGPIISDADRLIRMYNRWREDAKTNASRAWKHLWPDATHFAVGHIPYANLIYLKGALDYLMFYHIYEAMDPGWWQRTNRRLIKEQGRPMAGFVPGGGVPWGVPPAYLSTGNGQSEGLLGNKW